MAGIVEDVGNFSPTEIAFALELADIDLKDRDWAGNFVAVSEEQPGHIGGHVCDDPPPMTRGTDDLYWIATRPDVQGKGCGRALMAYFESTVQVAGCPLVVVTSSRESYGQTVGFYRRAEYEEASRIRDFYDARDDRLTYVKRFPVEEQA